MTFNILGCSKMASTIAQLFIQGGLSLNCTYNRTYATAELFTKTLKQGRAVSSLSNVSAAPVWIIGLSDTALLECSIDWLAQVPLKNTDLVIHLSGAHSSDVLRRCGASVLSLHCMAVFPCFFIPCPKHIAVGIEGDISNADKIMTIINAYPLKVFKLQAEKKALWHAIGVFASNFPFVLLDAASKLADEIGIEGSDSRPLLNSLLMGALSSYTTQGMCGLTGPVSRNDTVTVDKQFAKVSAFSAELGNLYLTLSKALATAHTNDMGTKDSWNAESIDH